MTAVLAAVACGGPDGMEDEVVPEGVLKIFADKTTIAADGVDCVTFKVMFGAENVSNEKTMKLVWTSGGKEVQMNAGANGTEIGKFVKKINGLDSKGNFWQKSGNERGLRFSFRQQIK